MPFLSIIITSIFFIAIIRQILYWSWLWQIKEYRIDRMMSHLKEENIVGSIVPLGLWSRSARQEISQSVNAKRLHRAIATMEPAAILKNNLFYIFAVVLFLSYFIFLKNNSLIFQYLVLAFFAFAFLGIIKEIKGRSLKRPKLTLKIVLVFSIMVVFYILLFVAYWIPAFAGMTRAKAVEMIEFLLFIIIVNPLIISSIVLVIEPIFIFQKKRIIKRASEKMRGLKKVKVIGITGSYGKTSTKEFLYAILSRKYKVVKTEGNNNTNIGVAYTVLNKVSDEYDYFICEMGAYKIGEIKEMCEIVKPSIGILTGINQQHIDLFGSQENIVKAKFELIEALPENGLAVINSRIKNQELRINNRELGIKTKDIKYFSLDDIRNIKVYQDCAEFEYICHCEEHQRRSNPGTMREESDDRIATLSLVVRNGSSIIKFKLNILGKHYIENLISAIIVAEYLEMSLDEIKSAVEKIKPTEFMMRKIEGLNNSIFIDDSYSANPDGVMAALDYLEEAYKDYKKIIVFPGIIELGKKSDEVHKILFNRISEVCDVAYILGIRNYESGIMNNECRFVFEKDFDRAADMVKNNLDKNTVVLFESRGAGAVMGKLKK
ncbi:MAG: Mur ligase family protein [Minisyncoccia bacterium]